MSQSAKIRKTLREAAKEVAKEPQEKPVHTLRTSIRKLEASGTKISKPLKQLRRTAGHVRDLDVLLKLTAELKLAAIDPEQTAALTEWIRAERELHARELSSLAQSLSKAAMPANHKTDCAAIDDVPAMIESVRHIALQRDYGHLGRHNLHEFRKELKIIRYRASLCGIKGPEFESLRQIKDAIGRWHDLMMLADLTDVALEHAQHRLMQRILAEYDRAYAHAIDTTRQSLHDLFSRSAKEIAANTSRQN